MPLPSKKDTLLAISFVFVGLIYALCDRWQRELTVQGVPTRKPHKFDHLFVMWTLRMLLQLGLFFLWKTIQNNWFGFACFRHGEQDDRGNVDAAQFPANNVNAREQDIVQFPAGDVNAREQDIVQFPAGDVNAREQDIVQFPAGDVNAREQDIVQFPAGDVNAREQDIVQFPAGDVNAREQDIVQFPAGDVNAREQDVAQFHGVNVNAWEQDMAPFPDQNINAWGPAGEQDMMQFQAENAEPHEHEVNDHQPLLEDLDEGGNQERADNNAVEQPPEEEVRIKRKTKKPSKLIYFPPAFFAMSHVLLLYFGLKLTYSSSFIMLKGSVAFFTALLSLAFLSQPIACFVWFGVVMATLGFVVSGISDYISAPNPGYEKYGIAAGDLLILMSQIMFATKIIYEQKFIKKHSIHPMLFLGCEGMYGSFFAITFLLLFNFVDAVQYSNLPNGRLEDFHDFMLQFANSWRVILAVLGSLASYIVYTYIGMFLIRDKGALSRIMIETFVWSIYWAVCLALHWENFFIIQIPGLGVITIGALIFLILPLFSRFQNAVNNEQENLDNPIDYNQQIHEQDQPAAGAGDLLQEGGSFRHDDNVLLIPEAQEADALRRRARETT